MLTAESDFGRRVRCPPATGDRTESYGADRRRLFALVIREGMALVAIGLVVGLGAGLFASEWIKSFLFLVSARDLTTFVGVPCMLAAVALLACYLPARRAMRVDPMVALLDS